MSSSNGESYAPVYDTQDELIKVNNTSDISQFITYNNDFTQNAKNINGNLITEIVDSNGNIVSDIVTVNNNDPYFFGNNYDNQNNTYYTCNNLPSQTLNNLCAYRVQSDADYARWISRGLAWWLGCYPENHRVSMGKGWEEYPSRYPLPMWWWKYPEIPAPSIEWLNQTFVMNGQTVPRRNYYLPPENTNIVQRIDARKYNPDCNYYYSQSPFINPTGSWTNGNGIPYSSSMLNVTGVADYPVNTKEGFDGCSNSNINIFVVLFMIILFVALIYFYINYHK